MVADASSFVTSFATTPILKCSTGTAKYVPQKNELLFAKLGKPGQDSEVQRVPGAKEFFRDFEEALLLNGRRGYVHPESKLLRIVYADCQDADPSDEQFCIYLNGRLWNFVSTRVLLDFVRTHALERRVVTDVPRPPDPTILTGMGWVLSVKKAGIIVINNDSSCLHHQYPINAKDFVEVYRADRFVEGYSLGPDPVFPSAGIVQVGDDMGAQYLSVFWPRSTDQVRINFDQMDDFVAQMERMPGTSRISDIICSLATARQP